jgi:hypothetical protein
MWILDTGLVIKFFKIIILIIFTFAKTNAFGAVSSLVGQKKLGQHPTEDTNWCFI